MLPFGPSECGLPAQQRMNAAYGTAHVCLHACTSDSCCRRAPSRHARSAVLPLHRWTQPNSPSCLLPAPQAELAAQQAEQELRRQRREAVAAEKAASQPPRLGKQKYEPEPVQVGGKDWLAGVKAWGCPCWCCDAAGTVLLQQLQQLYSSLHAWPCCWSCCCWTTVLPSATTAATPSPPPPTSPPAGAHL